MSVAVPSYKHECVYDALVVSLPDYSRMLQGMKDVYRCNIGFSLTDRFPTRCGVWTSRSIPQPTPPLRLPFALQGEATCTYCIRQSLCPCFRDVLSMRRRKNRIEHDLGLVRLPRSYAAYDDVSLAIIHTEHMSSHLLPQQFPRSTCTPRHDRKDVHK
jgi:hypothetical protein